MTDDLIALDGPRRGPASGEMPTKLVIFLHGRGANGDDLIGLAPAFAQAVPEAGFSAPNAPYPCEGAPLGFQWFSIENPDATARLSLVRETARNLNAFIDAELERLGLGDDDMALIGFSQGTMMALHLGLRRERQCAAVLAYSGRMMGPESLEAEISARPPVMLVHGTEDPLLPVALMDEAEAALKRAAVPVESHVREGLGHGIDEEGVKLGMQFLKQHLAGAA